MILVEKKRQLFEAEKKAIDIGFPAARLSRSEETKLRSEYRQYLKKNSEIEKNSRHLKCKKHCRFTSFAMKI